MPLILRAVKGSKLTITEMDDNLLWLAGNISGSGIIPVTGSGIDASNTPITSSFFIGNGSQLTNITASFVTASNVYGPYGASSVLSASFAINTPLAATASFVTASNVYGPFGSNSIISASYAVSASQATTASYANTINNIISGALDLSGSLTINGTLVVGGNTVAVGGSDTQIQFNSGSVFAGDAGFTYSYLSQSLQQGNNAQAIGIYSHAEGESTQAIGNYSHAEGSFTTAEGAASHAEGSLTTASGNWSHTEGHLTRTTNNYTHAEGYLTLASGQYSHAEGSQVTASGYASHAEGADTKATGVGSHAEGFQTLASGSYSHAEGRSNIAYGNYSHVEGGPSGLPNYTYGEYSHAEGGGNIAYGEGSHTEGYANQTSTAATFSHVAGAFNVTSASYQVVVGRYNARNNTSSLFVVGAGSAAGEVFKDAFSVEADFTQFPNPSHIVIPTNTLVPVNPKTGSMYYDTSTNKLWIWNGVWRSSSFGI